MGMVEAILAGMFAPAILFFMLGVATILVKSDLAIPPGMSVLLSIFLMVSIGLEGGVEAIEALAIAPGLIWVILITALLAVACGAFFAFSSGNIFRGAGLKTADAWAAGGHYGAVSSATLAVAIGIASAAQEEAIPGVLIFGGWMPAMYPFMDSPALITAIVFGRLALAKEGIGGGKKLETKKILRESILGRAVWLLVCSMLIGMIGQSFSPIETTTAMDFFDGMFRGVLALFMIDMGIAAGRQLRELKEMGRSLWKLALIALALPQVWGVVGIFGMYGIHSLMPGTIGWGDAFVFASIAGGASFITAPAAMRIAIPEANPSVYLPLSVALTFPFNLVIGMPLWKLLCMGLWGA